MKRRQFIQQATAAFGASALGVSRAASVLGGAPGVTDNEIRIGQSAVLSGPSANLGLEMKAGVEACFKAVNDRGGIGGRMLRLLTLDDGYDPERCAANTAKLIAGERAFALLGYVGTPTCNAAMPVFTASKVPFIGAFTGASSLRTPFNPNIFNVRAGYVDEGRPIVKQLTAFGTKVAIFHQNDAYGNAVRESIERALKAQGLQPVAIATVERNSLDVRQATEVLARSGADSVALGSVYAPSAELVKALRARGLLMQYASVSFIGTSGLLEKFGDSAKGIGIAQVMPYPLAGVSPITREYQKAMVEAGSSQFSYGSIEGFIGAKVLVEGLRRAGGTPSRHRLVAALESFGKFDLGGFGVNFTRDSHNGSTYVEMTVVGSNKTILR